MKYTPDGYGERCRFDAFCKTVLRNEARTHLRDLGRQRNREIEFSALSQQEMDKLCTVDEYPSDSFLFTAYGYALHIRDELVADAFASLPEQEQGILILHCVLELADGEIGGLVGMSRSAVQRHRTKALNELRKLLPLSVIEAARAGDPLAVERVLWYYEGYMDKLCTRTLYDLDGSPRVRVDEYMKRRLQSRLIRAILNSP